MPHSLFQSAYIRVRVAIGEDNWRWLTDLQRADLIGCEMQRLADIGQDQKTEPQLSLPKQTAG